MSRSKKIYRIVIASLIVFVIFNVGSAQNRLEIEWEKVIGDIGPDYLYGVKMTEGGNLFLGGTFTKPDGYNLDFWFINMNQDGEILSETLNGSDSRDDQLTSLKKTGDNTFIYSGNTSPDFPETGDILLGEIDTAFNGWSGIVDDPEEYLSCFDLIKSGDSLLIGVGKGTQDQAGSGPLELAMWQGGLLNWMNYEYSPYSKRNTAVVKLNDSVFVAAGETSAFPSEDFDIYIRYFYGFSVGSGEIVFRKDGEQEVEDMVLTPDSGFILTGSSQPMGFPREIFIQKLNKNGEEEWYKTYASSYHSSGRDIEVLSEGGYLISGYGKKNTFSDGWDIWILRVNDNGDTLWTEFVEKPGHDEVLHDLEIVDDHTFIVCGTQSSTDSSVNGYVARLRLNPLFVEENHQNQYQENFQLWQNYPNPFNVQTIISFRVLERSTIVLDIINLEGKIMKTLYTGILEPGEYRKVWNAESVPSGMYFCRIKNATGAKIVRKMILIK